MDDKKMDQEVVEGLKKIFSAINGGFHKEIVAAVEHVLETEHRTLQQCFMRDVIVPAIENFAGREHFDLRNQDSIVLAKALKSQMEKTGSSLRYI